MITPSFALDWTTGLAQSAVSVTRLGTATFVDASNTLQSASADTQRVDYSTGAAGLLIEESRINSIRNNTMQGAATLPFTPPTNWSITAVAGLSASITGLGTENGINYIDIRLNGTATGAQLIAFDTTTGITAASGQAWSTSFYCKLVGGSLSNVVHLKPRVTERTAVGGSVVAGTGNAFVPNASSLILQRTIYTRTLTGGVTVARLQPAIEYSVAGAVDFTIRVGLPQCEIGAFTTSVIKTSNAAVTRNADIATITGSNFSDFWQALKGGATVQATPITVIGICPLVQFDDNTANEIIALRGNTTNPELYIVDGGAPQVQLDAGTIVANTPYSLTGWWQTNDCKARQDSGATVSDYTATIPTVTQMRIGSDGVNYLNGIIATISYYDSFLGQPIYTRRKNKVFSSLL